MRYALIADIHGNLEALDSVLAEIDARKPDGIFCLGDVVGYGANPGECLARIRERDIPTVAGNHDCAACGRTSVEGFNPDARASALWTQDTLSQEDKGWLAALPLSLHRDGIALAHGTLLRPELFDYVMTVEDAVACMDAHSGAFAFVAHTHVPIACLLHEAEFSVANGGAVEVPEGARALINVGSVGQPRDMDPRACFCLFDTALRRAETVRVPYDIEAAAAKVLRAGLPVPNALRLRIGK